MHLARSHDESCARPVADDAADVASPATAPTANAAWRRSWVNTGNRYWWHRCELGRYDSERRCAGYDAVPVGSARPCRRRAACSNLDRRLRALRRLRGLTQEQLGSAPTSAASWSARSTRRRQPDPGGHHGRRRGAVVVDRRRCSSWRGEDSAEGAAGTVVAPAAFAARAETRSVPRSALRPARLDVRRRRRWSTAAVTSPTAALGCTRRSRLPVKRPLSLTLSPLRGARGSTGPQGAGLISSPAIT